MNIEQLVSAIMSHQKDGATKVTVDESYEVIGCEFNNGVIIIVTGEDIPGFDKYDIDDTGPELDI